VLDAQASRRRPYCTGLPYCDGSAERREAFSSDRGTHHGATADHRTGRLLILVSTVVGMIAAVAIIIIAVTRHGRRSQSASSSNADNHLYCGHPSGPIDPHRGPDGAAAGSIPIAVPIMPADKPTIVAIPITLAAHQVLIMITPANSGFFPARTRSPLCSLSRFSLRDRPAPDTLSPAMFNSPIGAGVHSGLDVTQLTRN
jgi:hypothetical protein